jgi:hypothetical protein
MATYHYKNMCNFWFITTSLIILTKLFAETTKILKSQHIIFLTSQPTALETIFFFLPSMHTNVANIDLNKYRWDVCLQIRKIFLAF